MSYTIFFPTGIENLDTFNDNVDVCIRFDDGTEYTVVVITPDNLSEMMKKECMPYIMPDFRFLVVKELSFANIQRLISVLIEDKYLLEFYGSDIKE